MSKMDFGQSDYPFPGGVVDLSSKNAVETYLAKFNKAMADVENGILRDNLVAGMAGVGGAYSLPTPDMDHAKTGMTLQK